MVFCGRFMNNENGILLQSSIVGFQVRIFKPAKNPMQSGTAGIKRYLFDGPENEYMQIARRNNVTPFELKEDGQVILIFLTAVPSGGRLSLTTSRGGRTT